MAKRVTKGFASKTERALMDKLKKCPICDEDIVRVKHIKTSSTENSMKFTENVIKVCKCNKSEIYK